MTETSDPSKSDPAKKKLFVAIALAVVAAVLIAVMQILPAQFGIDLTGFGKYTGLDKKYEAKLYFQKLRNTTEKKESETIEVPAHEELEFKLYMLEGDQVQYQWKVDGGEIYYDFHGERGGVHTARVDSYAFDTAAESQGTFKATFEGTHGWYWRNDSDSLITISLETQGKYSHVGIQKASFSR